jgi:hypothetical protein
LIPWHGRSFKERLDRAPLPRCALLPEISILVGWVATQGGAPPPNEAPTDIQISSATIVSDAASGTVVGALTATDVDDSSFTWEIINGNTKFELSSSTGLTVNLRRSATGTLSIGVSENVQIRITDGGLNTYQETLSIAVTDPAEVVQVDTLTITNLSGSTLATNFVTDIFGLAFKKGDIPSGSYPRIELSDGTLCPATFSNFSTWSDGSLKNGYGFCRVPESLAGSGTKTLNIKNNGTAPSASGFTTANINASASRDFKVTLTGVENLSGAFTSALNQGITDNDKIYKDCDGDAGAIWVVEEECSAHSHLLARHYIRVGKDASAAVYDWLWCPLVFQPKMNTATPLRRAFQMAVFDGASEFSTGYHGSGTVTYAGTASRLNWTAHGMASGEGFTVSNSGGALPAGLTAGTVYFASVITANQIEVWSKPMLGENGSGALVAFSTSGSGTHTGQRVTALDLHGGVYGMQTDGKWQWVAGSAAARPNLSILQSAAYQHSTKLFPPWDLTLTPDATASINYAPNTAGDQRRFIGAGGGHPQIGLWPMWSIIQLMRRDTTSERVARVNGLVSAHLNIWVYDETTRQFPVYNNKSYSGLPASSLTVRYNGNGENISGMNWPPSQWDLFSQYDTSHNCSAPTHQFLVFGGPVYRDIVASMAGMSTLGRYTDPGEGRQITVGPTTYYANALFFPSLPRVDAWSFRDQVGSFLLPDAHPDGTASTAHLQDMATGTADCYVAYRNTKSAQYRSSGIYESATRADGQGSPWAYPGYFGWALAWGAGISEDADITTVAQHVANFYAAITTAQSMYGLTTAYMMGVNNTDHGSNANDFSEATVITDPTLICFQGGITATTDAGTDVVTLVLPAGSPTLADNDVIAVNSISGALPGGLNGFQPYYMRDVSGSTGKVAATPGGTAINITTTGSFNPMMAFPGETIPSGSDGITPGDNYEGSYSALHHATMCTMLANGLTGLTTAKSQNDTIIANGTHDYQVNPIHAYQPTF